MSLNNLKTKKVEIIFNTLHLYISFGKVRCSGSSGTNPLKKCINITFRAFGCYRKFYIKSIKNFIMTFDLLESLKKFIK